MEQQKILFVDDEPNVLAALERCFFDDDYEIHTASGGAEGLVIAKEADFALIVSDYRMPEMTGVEFLTQAKAVCPDATRVLLTGYADMKAVIDAINLGEVHRFLTKPWDDHELRQTVHQALERHTLISENKRLQELTALQNLQLRQWNEQLEGRIRERTREIQEKNQELGKLVEQVKLGFINSINIFSGLLEAYDHVLGGHSLRVADLTQQLAIRIGLTKDYVEIVTIAAQLHDIGKIGLPKSIARAKEEELAAEPRELLRRHTVIGEELVNFGDHFEKVGRLIRSHHEHYDGTGYPDGLAESAIPIGARIITLVNAYDQQLSAARDDKSKVEAILREIQRESGSRFDPELVGPFVELLRESITAPRKETPMEVMSLKPGMVLAKDVVAGNGQVLLEQGRLLRTIDITRLRNHNRGVGAESVVKVLC